jgi:hypothetical protein
VTGPQQDPATCPSLTRTCHSAITMTPVHSLCVFSVICPQMRTRARTALTRYTAGAISELQSGAGDALRGVDWAAVARYVDLGRALDK